MVLPEPEGPRMATNSLSRKDRLTLSSATCANDWVTYLLQIPLSSNMDGNLSHAGALARSPPPFVFDAFVLLYPHFLPAPVRNVGNRAKKRTGRRPKRGPERDLYMVELILKGSGLLRTAAHDARHALRVFYCSLFAIAWSISLSSAARCSAELMAPTIGSPTMLPF